MQQGNSEDGIEHSDSENLGRRSRKSCLLVGRAQSKLTAPIVLDTRRDFDESGADDQSDDDHEFHRRNLDDDYGIEIDGDDDNDADDLDVREPVEFRGDEHHLTPCNRPMRKMKLSLVDL